MKKSEKNGRRGNDVEQKAAVVLKKNGNAVRMMPESMFELLTESFAMDAEHFDAAAHLSKKLSAQPEAEGQLRELLGKYCRHEMVHGKLQDCGKHYLFTVLAYESNDEDDIGDFVQFICELSSDCRWRISDIRIFTPGINGSVLSIFGYDTTAETESTREWSRKCIADRESALTERADVS